MRFLLGISIIAALAWGQDGRPARPKPAQSPAGIADIVSRINREAEAAQKAETDFAAALEKGPLDPVKAASLVDQSDTSVKAIKQLLDQLDARYESLSEDQRGVVRQAWTISMLLGAFVANQKDALDSLKTEQGRTEAQVNAQCAVRRAAMLAETLRGLAR